MGKSVDLRCNGLCNLIASRRANCLKASSNLLAVKALNLNRLRCRMVIDQGKQPPASSRGSAVWRSRVRNDDRFARTT